MADFLDLIIEGNILTMSDARPRATAVGVCNGMIAIVGEPADVKQKAGQNTQRLVFKDQTVIPGYRVSHYVGRLLAGYGIQHPGQSQQRRNDRLG